MCSIIISVLKILQVIPASFFGSELQANLRITTKPFCGEGKNTYQRNIPMCEILKLGSLL